MRTVSKEILPGTQTQGIQGVTRSSQADYICLKLVATFAVRLRLRQHLGSCLQELKVVSCDAAWDLHSSHCEVGPKRLGQSPRNSKPPCLQTGTLKQISCLIKPRTAITDNNYECDPKGGCFNLYEGQLKKTTLPPTVFQTSMDAHQAGSAFRRPICGWRSALRRLQRNHSLGALKKCQKTSISDLKAARAAGCTALQGLDRLFEPTGPHESADPVLYNRLGSETFIQV